MTESHGHIPYALTTAHGKLVAALDKGIKQYKANRRNSNSDDVCRCIERFVDAINQEPSWQHELESRATFVEKRCGPGSDFRQYRANALASHKGQLHNHLGSKTAIGRLREPKGNQRTLHDVASDRKIIERILNEGILNLGAGARQLFETWLSTCRELQREADPLEVDGCWYLFNIHAASENNPSGRAMFAKASIQFSGGGQNLDAIKTAADSIMDWVRSNRSEAAVGKPTGSLNDDALKDYETATDIRTKRTPAGIVLDHRRLVKFLALHQTIRRTRPLGNDGKPRKNRLLIHLGDWVKHQDALTEWDKADSDSIDTASDGEIAERTVAVRRKKQHGK